MANAKYISIVVSSERRTGNILSVVNNGTDNFAIVMNNNNVIRNETTLPYDPWKYNSYLM